MPDHSESSYLDPLLTAVYFCEHVLVRTQWGGDELCMLQFCNAPGYVRHLDTLYQIGDDGFQEMVTSVGLPSVHFH